MCRPATCRQCGKTGWAGCGQHVDQVMAGVAPDERCTCPSPAAAPAGSGRKRRWWFSR